MLIYKILPYKEFLLNFVYHKKQSPLLFAAFSAYALLKLSLSFYTALNFVL